MTRQRQQENSEVTEEQRKRREWTRQLSWEFEILCEHYRIPLTRPLFRIDESLSFWGQFDPSTRTIVLNLHLIHNYRWDQVIEILKHEMAHQIVYEHFRVNDHTHGHLFQKACAMLQVAPWAIRASGGIGDPLPRQGDEEELSEDASLLRKARGLLALSRSDNEHEALLAMQRLQDLSRRYNLDQLLSQRSRLYCYRIINHKKKRIAQHQSYIANILQKHFFVDIVFSSEYDACHLESYKTMEILGTSENVRIAEYVYHYLWNQLPRMWNLHKKSGASGQKAKRAYLLGILESVDEKLSGQNQQGAASSIRPESTDLTLLSSELPHRALEKARAELNAFVRRRHPKLRSQRWQANHEQWDSYEKGRRDGRNLEIHKGLARSSSDNVRALPSSPA